MQPFCQPPRFLCGPFAPSVSLLSASPQPFYIPFSATVGEGLPSVIWARGTDVHFHCFCNSVVGISLLSVVFVVVFLSLLTTTEQKFSTNSQSVYPVTLLTIEIYSLGSWFSRQTACSKSKRTWVWSPTLFSRMWWCTNPGLGEWPQEEPRRLLAQKSSQSMNSRFKEPFCPHKEEESNWKETHTINLWPPHTCVQTHLWVYMHTKF